jgi:hypothetical protein
MEKEPTEEQCHIGDFVNQKGECDLDGEIRLSIKILESLMNGSIPRTGRGWLLGNVSLFDIAALAIDALGNSDPDYLLDVYRSGGKIDNDNLGDLATAIIRSNRNHSDSLDEFNKLRQRHEK